MLYFAYGSNMSSRRLQQRVPSAQPVSIATLPQHRLEFHKIGKDNSAKCNALQTHLHDHFVMGVVFDIHHQEKTHLDQAEGLGNGYETKQVSLINDSGEKLQAFTYYATHIDDALAPYHWYKQHVLHGAQEHGLPGFYIESIRQIDSIEDPSEQRAAKETAIHFLK